MVTIARGAGGKVARAAAVVLLLLNTHCSDEDRPAGLGGDNPRPVPNATRRCSTPQENCPCAVPGKEVECGVAKDETQGSIACATGVRTCDGNTWGSCSVATTSDNRIQSLMRLKPLALGGSVGCASVCDPFCNVVTDTPVGVPVTPGSGVVVTPDGLSLTRTAVSQLGTPCTSVTITPSPTSLVVTQFSPVLPNTVQFSASVVPAGCYPGTPPFLWAIDRFDIATVSPSGLVTLVSPSAGPIRVTAYAGGLSATATLNVRLDILDTSAAPAGTAVKFTTAPGTEDTGTQVLYPYHTTVLPLGLLAPVLQWRVGSAGAAAAVKVSLRYPATGTPTFRWSKIVPENQTISLNPPTNTITLASGPRFTFPQNVWFAFEQTAKGADVAITLQRLTGPVATSVLRSELPTGITFATNQLKGTVYYQSYGTNLALNYGPAYSPQTIGAGARFGAATLAIVPGSSYPTVAAGYYSPGDGPGCRVCHSASATGAVLVSNVFPNNTDSVLYRLGTDPANGGLSFAAPNAGKFSWPAIYPDGTFLFGNSGPTADYGGAAPPGALDGTASGAPANALYSLIPGSVGNSLTSTGIPAALRAALPVFSPDGTKLAFNHYSGTVSGKVGDKRSLGTMDFKLSTRTFSNFRRLWDEPATACSTAFGTTDPCTNLWPTFFPGNEGVAYEREVFNNGRVVGKNHSDFGGTRSGCDDPPPMDPCGDDGTKADIWWVSLGATPVRTALNKANGLNASSALSIPVGVAPTVNAHTAVNEPLLNYEPNFNPQAVGGYYWLTFTSRRLYGNIATMNPWWSDPRFRPIGGQFGPTTKKIWVSAIDPTAAPGTDPSRPAFYLPGQELLAGNSKAFWASEACTVASNTRSTANLCESNLDCCGAPTTAVCSLQTPITDPPKRHCIPLNSDVCIPDDAITQCVADTQCCGFSAGSRCANGRCRVPPPLLLFDNGEFVRDFKADCPRETRPVWRSFQWRATVPTGTSINFSAATAQVPAELSAAPVVNAGTASPPPTSAWSNNPVQIDTELAAAGLKSFEYLRVRMTINPSSDRLSAPVLKDWRVVYDCNAAE